MFIVYKQPLPCCKSKIAGVCPTYRKETKER